MAVASVVSKVVERILPIDSYLDTMGNKLGYNPKFGIDNVYIRVTIWQRLLVNTDSEMDVYSRVFYVSIGYYGVKQCRPMLVI